MKSILVGLCGILAFHAVTPAHAGHGGAPGGGTADGWLDAHGDTLYGPLNMAGGTIRFNGVDFASPAAGQLTMGGNRLCIANQVVTGCAAGGVTTVNTGAGLTGGPITSTGTVSLSINGGASQSCSGTNKVSALSATGIVTCAVDANSGGTVTSVAAGSGLTGGPITTTGTLSIATGGITGAMIQDGTVGSADLGSASVANAKIAAQAVTGDKISPTTTITAAGYSYDVAKMRRYIVSDVEWLPSSSATTYTKSTGVAGTYSTQADGFVVAFRAPLHLPDGATVKGFTAYVVDSSATRDINVQLWKHNVGSASYLGGLGSATTSGAPGATTLAVTGLAVPIDNTAASTHLSASWITDGTPTNLVIRDVVVEYTIAGPNP